MEMHVIDDADASVASPELSSARSGFNWLPSSISLVSVTGALEHATTSESSWFLAFPKWFASFLGRRCHLQRVL